MPGLPAGDYRISCGALGPGAAVLYLTFPGSNVPLTVDVASMNGQVWTVTGNPGQQTITPQTTGFKAYATIAGQYVQAITSPCSWNINFDTHLQLYIIQAVGAALNWDLAASPAPGVKVALATPSGNMPQYWKFQDPSTRS